MRLINADDLLKKFEEQFGTPVELIDWVPGMFIKNIIDDAPTAEIVCSPGAAIRFKKKEEEK